MLSHSETKFDTAVIKASPYPRHNFKVLSQTAMLDPLFAAKVIHPLFIK
jgi:hypothetical protein